MEFRIKNSGIEYGQISQLNVSMRHSKSCLLFYSNEFHTIIWGVSGKLLENYNIPIGKIKTKSWKKSVHKYEFNFWENVCLPWRCGSHSYKKYTWSLVLGILGRTLWNPYIPWLDCSSMELLPIESQAFYNPDIYGSVNGFITQTTNWAQTRFELNFTNCERRRMWMTFKV